MSYPLNQSPVPVWAAPNRVPIHINLDQVPPYLISNGAHKSSENGKPVYLKQSGRWNSFMYHENETTTSTAQHDEVDPTLLNLYDLDTKWDYKLHQEYEEKGVISKVNIFKESFVKALAINPFFPIILRGSASLFTVITLGLSSAVFVQTKVVRLIPGTIYEFPSGHSPTASTIFTLIVSVVSFVYLIFSLWDETFGQPLGLRKVTHKLKFVAMDLIVMCLTSASLAASFEVMISRDYICPAKQNTLVCRLQKSVISFILITLTTLFLTFLASTFRMVGRAST